MRQNDRNAKMETSRTFPSVCRNGPGRFLLRGHFDAYQLFVDLRDESNKCVLILEVRKEGLGRTYNFGVEILRCCTDRVGLKRMAEGRKRNNPLQVIASNLLARPDNHAASATNQSVRFNYGAASDFASTS